MYVIHGQVMKSAQALGTFYSIWKTEVLLPGSQTLRSHVDVLFELDPLAQVRSLRLDKISLPGFPKSKLFIPVSQRRTQEFLLHAKCHDMSMTDLSRPFSKLLSSPVKKQDVRDGGFSRREMSRVDCNPSPK